MTLECDNSEQYTELYYEGMCSNDGKGNSIHGGVSGKRSGALRMDYSIKYCEPNSSSFYFY